MYSQFSRHAHERASQMMSTRLNDMLELMLHAERATSYLSQVNDASTLDRTRALAEIVRLNPAVLRSQEALQGVCNRLGAEQIAVTDQNGTIVAAVPAMYVGTNLAQSDEMRPFLPCTVAPGTELCHRSTSADPDLRAMQYAGVHRQDARGAVLLGFRARVEQQAREADSFNRTTPNLRMGEGGRVFIFRRGALLTREDPGFSPAKLLAIPANTACEMVLNDEDYYAYAVEGEGYRLVGAVPASEMYRMGVRAAQSLLLSNLLLFLAMFAVVSYLLQRLVVRGISRVNETLREITDGHLDKRVEVEYSPEFARLSNGINFMVDSIQALGEEQRKSIERDLELARTIQTTAVPCKFPAFPHISAFDLHAISLQARVVGGDFYDFFMPDEQHLHFLVADVDSSGVPAALYMMRALSLIRTLAHAGVEPVDLVTRANRELCEGNRAGMRMALFYGRLDIRSGEVEYVNAGSVHSLLQRRGSEYELLRGRSDSTVGTNPSSVFHTSTLHLSPQDRLLFYTEGVVHTVNAENTPFGEGRLQEALHEHAPTVADALQLVRSALRQFTDDAGLQRDITMLCLEYKGDMLTTSSCALKSTEVDALRAYIAERMEAIFAAPPDIADVQQGACTLAAALPPDTPVRVELDCDTRHARLNIIYPGPSYNPLEQLPDLPVDRVRFRFSEKKGNELTFWKKLK